MYLLCSSALRDSHRVLMGTWRQRVSMYPSSRHGRAVAEAAVGGGGLHTEARGLRKQPFPSKQGFTLRVGLLCSSDRAC